MQKGQLFIIPIQIADNATSSLPQSTIDIIHSTKYYIVERARTARRFISQTKPPYKIEELQILEFEDSSANINSCIQWLKEGHSVGVMSESGMPGLADPGQLMCSEAHKEQIKIIPLVGPNSILMAMAASGLNGQNFAFGGYLPIKEPELKKRLKSIEGRIMNENQTQIFIETPYRNDRLLKAFIQSMNSNIKLCIASDITGDSEMIKTQSILHWKKNLPSIGKIPTIFLLGK